MGYSKRKHFYIYCNLLSPQRPMVLSFNTDLVFLAPRLQKPPY
jgi:hypothetical protein